MSVRRFSIFHLYKWADNETVLKRIYVFAALPLAVIVAYWTIWSYAASTTLEAKKPILQRQLDIYTNAAKVTGDLAALPRGPDWDHARNRFWSLYWGELAMVESRDVATKMVDFGNTLQALKSNLTESAWLEKQETLHGLSLAVAHAARDSLEREWKVTLPSISSIVESGKKND